MREVYGRFYQSCSWCHETNELIAGNEGALCKHCSHQAHVARMFCSCSSCAGRAALADAPAPRLWRFSSPPPPHRGEDD